MKFKALVTLLVGIALVGGGCVQNEAPASSQVPKSDSPTTIVTSTESVGEIRDYPETAFFDDAGSRYILEFVGEDGQVSSYKESGKKYYQQLVRIGTGEERTVLVPNITGVAQKMGVKSDPFQDHHSFHINALPAGSTKLILFQDTGLDGFMVPHPYWSFDFKTKDLKKLENISKYTGSQMYLTFSANKHLWLGIYENESANGCTGESRNLYLFNFLNDTVKTLVTLPKGETFNSRYCGYHGGGYDIELVSDTTASYSVYDQTKADPNYLDKTEVVNKPLLYKKTVSF